jgi:predicted GNAT family acetyltransferase
MEKQLTAVNWLVSQLNKKGFAQVVTDEEIEQAKEMEKQQIMKTRQDIYVTGDLNNEQYYNETFKSE